MTIEEPLWEAVGLEGDTLRRVITLIAEEGVNRVLPLEDRMDAIQELITERLHKGDPDPTLFLENVGPVLVEVAARLGFAMAQTLNLGNFEDWLQAAICRAGLENYTPPAALHGDAVK